MTPGLVLAIPLLLGASDGLRDDAYRVAILEAMDPMYRLDYGEAIDRLGALGERYPEHPGPPLAQASAIWLRELFRREDLNLERFVSPGYFTEPSEREMPAGERAMFEALVAESQARARSLLETEPGHPDARYYLGSAEGVLGAFAITIGREKLDALGHGKVAYRWHRELVEEHPDYDDAYMTVGVYEYLVDNLPWYIKWLAVIAGYNGSERLGFEYLVRAAKEGRFVGVDARVLLMVLYVREEQYHYALRLADELIARFPENFLFHFNGAHLLERMSRFDEALERYRVIEAKAAAGAPAFGAIPLGELRYALGRKLFRAGELDEALERFELAASDPATTAETRALSHLEQGRILDLLGRRAEALSHYRRVAEMENVNGSRELASEYSKTPFDDGPGRISNGR